MYLYSFELKSFSELNRSFDASASVLILIRFRITVWSTLNFVKESSRVCSFKSLFNFQGAFQCCVFRRNVYELYHIRLGLSTLFSTFLNFFSVRFSVVCAPQERFAIITNLSSLVNTFFKVFLIFFEFKNTLPRVSDLTCSGYI